MTPIFGRLAATCVSVLALAHAMQVGASTPNVAAPSSVPSQGYPAIAKAPAGAPNILLVLTDDVGFGAASTFGGPVPTPNLDRLAAQGLKYNQFHTTAMCSPTRAALLTGRNHHAVNMGSLTDFPQPEPGYNGMMPKSAATVAEVLRENGYNTAFLGKHHDMPHGPFSSAGPRDFWPTSMGFEYFFGFLGSDTDQWRPTLYRNSLRVIDDKLEPILDQRMVDEAIGWIHQQKAADPDKPFFLYFAPGSAHTPHQAPADWIARFRGKFAGGWEEAARQTLSRQKAMGLVPKNTQLPVWSADIPKWSSLRPEERALQERMMEAFAAQLSFQDAQFGRILDELDRMGQRDNTLIVFVEGDNGPDSAGSPEGSLAEASEHANRRLTPAERWTRIDAIGGPLVHSNYGTGWAQAMSTPFPFYKQIASHLGGTRNGAVISWPKGIAQTGLRTQYHHVIDVFPTLLHAAGVEAPAQVDGLPQQPVDGVDMTYSFANPAAPSDRKVQYYEMLGNRAIYADGWMASTTPQRRPWQMASGPSDDANLAPDYKWELYNLKIDFNQTHDLAKANPKQLARMQQLFDVEARRNHVYPLDDRTGIARSGSAVRAYVPARSHYEYWGKGISLPGDVAPPLGGRAFRVSADVTIGDGVLAAVGSNLGGWSFGVENGHPAVHHGLSALVSDQFSLIAPGALPPGQTARLDFDFDYAGGGFGKGGIVRIFVDGKQVAEKPLERSMVIQDGFNENFDVGFDGGVPVAETPGRSNAYTAELRKLTVDLGPPGQARAGQ